MSETSNNPYPVDPTGYLIGSFLAAILFGCHTSQVYQYYRKFRSDPWRLHLLVGWVYTLSVLQILIIVSTAWKYYVDGIHNPRIWGEFWWPLSFQDGLCYFGRRAYILMGRRKWFLWLVTIWGSITALCGVALAVTAFLWAADPWVSHQSFSARSISVPSQVVAILWMGLSASLDGILTVTLIRCLWRARSPTFDSTNDVIRRLIALTLETVLLTHICGAVMCVLFLSQPAAHRTKTTAFWIFLEIITELYSLSVVFTINARSAARRTLQGPKAPPTPVPARSTSPTAEQAPPTRDFRDQRQLDFAVEGFQEIPRFSYHFPQDGTTGPSGAWKGSVRGDDAVEMKPLGDAEKGLDGKGAVESASTGETQEEEVLRRKRFARWRR
ncbi:hypothetical protein NCC49_005263 [Naganishia albida]|nr:hypothetical protein NCC49_005263 [Naganishia albida]